MRPLASAIQAAPPRRREHRAQDLRGEPPHAQGPPHLFRVALGSAAEVGACLDVAVALEYLAAEEVAPALELLDWVRAMTYRLANG